MKHTSLSVSDSPRGVARIAIAARSVTPPRFVVTLRTGRGPTASWTTHAVTRHVSAQRLRPSRLDGSRTRQAEVAP
jgi:hypothetical protein